MIVFDLSCIHGHRFEGWFANAAAFDAQVRSGLLVCPVCQSTEVRKLPTASHVMTRSASSGEIGDSHGRPIAPPMDPETALRTVLGLLRASSEDVGDRFAEEARRIHYHAAPERSIHGKTTEHERRGLRDEGIDFLSIPDLSPESMN